MFNFKKISQGIYLVKTQAGFRQAIKSYCNKEPVNGNSWSKTFKYMRGYPEEYPAIIAPSVRYYGYHYLHINWISLKDMRKKICLFF